jgi:hypothetical protein
MHGIVPPPISCRLSKTFVMQMCPYALNNTWYSAMLSYFHCTIKENFSIRLVSAYKKNIWIHGSGPGKICHYISYYSPLVERARCELGSPRIWTLWQAMSNTEHSGTVSKGTVCSKAVLTEVYCLLLKVVHAVSLWPSEIKMVCECFQEFQWTIFFSNPAGSCWTICYQLECLPPPYCHKSQWTNSGAIFTIFGSSDWYEYFI